MYKINRFVSWNTGKQVFSAVRHKVTTAAIYSNDDYQYLQKSVVPMYHFQKSLPRLPIPEVDKTCDRYLISQRPLLNDKMYQETEAITNDFRKSLAPLLNDLLKIYDREHKDISYITEPWSDMYLRDRVPLPINYTPFMVFQPDSRPEYNDQLIRTTNLIIHSLRFMNSLYGHSLEPEVYHMNPRKSDTEMYRKVTRFAPALVATYVSYAFKAFPLDMSQYQGLFGATRIPLQDKDKIYRKSNTRHLAVLRRGHIFSVDVIDEQGKVEAPEVILARMKSILSRDLQPNENPLGVMTTDNRNTWASVRQHLEQTGNKNVLEAIDSALFCLCLDDEVYDVADLRPVVRDALCSTGANRWFDKSFSLIVAKDGTSTVNFEHSWGDGVAVLRYFNEVYKASTKNPYVHPGTKPSDRANVEQSVRHLKLQLDERAKEAIASARQSHESKVDSLDINFIEYFGLSKPLCKQFGLSPDSIMQLAIQLAYFKQTGGYTATYESCSTAAFRHGRTETIRPCTVETKAFCDAAETADQLNSAKLRELIDACSQKHNKLTKEAAMGQGFDRHLFALKYMAKIHGHPVPSFYNDEAYAAINHNVLSTSTLSSPALFAGGFGPVVKNGYGIGYGVRDKSVGSIVINYKGQRNGHEFVDCLHKSYKDIKEIVEAAPMPKKASK